MGWVASSGTGSQTRARGQAGAPLLRLDLGDDLGEQLGRAPAPRCAPEPGCRPRESPSGPPVAAEVPPLSPDGWATARERRRPAWETSARSGLLRRREPRGAGRERGDGRRRRESTTLLASGGRQRAGVAGVEDRGLAPVRRLSGRLATVAAEGAAPGPRGVSRAPAVAPRAPVAQGGRGHRRGTWRSRARLEGRNWRRRAARQVCRSAARAPARRRPPPDRRPAPRRGAARPAVLLDRPGPSSISVRPATARSASSSEASSTAAVRGGGAPAQRERGLGVHRQLGAGGLGRGPRPRSGTSLGVGPASHGLTVSSASQRRCDATPPPVGLGRCHECSVPLRRLQRDDLAGVAWSLRGVALEPRERRRRDGRGVRGRDGRGDRGAGRGGLGRDRLRGSRLRDGRLHRPVERRLGPAAACRQPVQEARKPGRRARQRRRSCSGERGGSSRGGFGRGGSRRGGCDGLGLRRREQRQELLVQLADAAEARLGPLVERAAVEALHRLGQLGRGEPQLGDVVVRGEAGEHLPHQHAQRVQVGARIRVGAGDDLGREVAVGGLLASAPGRTGSRGSPRARPQSTTRSMSGRMTTFSGLRSAWAPIGCDASSAAASCPRKGSTSSRVKVCPFASRESIIRRRVSPSRKL